MPTPLHLKTQKLDRLNPLHPRLHRPPPHRRCLHRRLHRPNDANVHARNAWWPWCEDQFQRSESNVLKKYRKKVGEVRVTEVREHMK